YVKDAWVRPGPEPTHPRPKEADIELTAFAHYESFLGGGSCIGGGGSGAARVNPRGQIITEGSGCLIMHHAASNVRGDSLFHRGGLRWTPMAARRFSPFAQFMFGGRKVTQEIDNLALRSELLRAWNDGSGTLAHYPKRSDWSAEVTHNGPSI